MLLLSFLCNSLIVVSEHIILCNPLRASCSDVIWPVINQQWLFCLHWIQVIRWKQAGITFHPDYSSVYCLLLALLALLANLVCNKHKLDTRLYKNATSGAILDAILDAVKCECCCMSVITPVISFMGPWAGSGCACSSYQLALLIMPNTFRYSNCKCQETGILATDALAL